MISVAEATALIGQHSLSLPDARVGLAEAPGRVLAEPVYADRDFPPFDRVMMDGIAIRSADWQKGTRAYGVAGTQTAGMAPMALGGTGQCLEVMTGAVAPRHADMVFRYEDIAIADGVATISAQAAPLWQHIHRQGTDRAKGALLVSQGTRLSPAEIAILATVGHANPLVKGHPRIAVVSTGDELVGVGTSPLPYQIRRSNSHALVAAMAEIGMPVQASHVHDEPEQMAEKLGTVIANHDVVVLSGGVSKGRKDYVPDTLTALGVEKHFHRVAQRPGKPFWFGTTPTGKAVFALPGNPVSTFLCYCQYVKPWLLAQWGLPPQPRLAVLDEPFAFAPPLAYFLQVKLAQSPTGQWLATPLKGKGSGDLANLLDTDAFMALPAQESQFAKGQAYPIIPFKRLG